MARFQQNVNLVADPAHVDPPSVSTANPPPVSAPDPTSAVPPASDAKANPGPANPGPQAPPKTPEPSDKPLEKEAKSPDGTATQPITPNQLSLANKHEEVQIEKYVAPVSVPLAHWHRVGKSPIGTFKVASTGIAWELPGHPEESFQDRPCTALKSFKIDDVRTIFDLRIDGRMSNQRYQLKADSPTALDSVNTALFALCSAAVMGERLMTSFMAQNAQEFIAYGAGARLLSQDEGDAVVFHYETPAPWTASIVVDVNQNGQIDSEDIEFGTQGSNPCDRHVTTNFACNEFQSKGILNIEQRLSPASPFFSYRSPGPLITAVTRTIPKSELTLKSAFVALLLKLYNTQTREVSQSPLSVIPFAMASVR